MIGFWIMRVGASVVLLAGFILWRTVARDNRERAVIVVMTLAAYITLRILALVVIGH